MAILNHRNHSKSKQVALATTVAALRAAVGVEDQLKSHVYAMLVVAGKSLHDECCCQPN
jgi:hypothetical protein